MLQYTYTNVRINIYMYYYTCINILLYIYTHIHTYIYICIRMTCAQMYNGSAMAGPTGIDQPIFGKLKKKTSASHLQFDDVWLVYESICIFCQKRKRYRCTEQAFSVFATGSRRHMLNEWHKTVPGSGWEQSFSDKRSEWTPLILRVCQSNPWNTQVCSRPYAAICCCCVYMFMCIYVLYLFIPATMIGTRCKRLVE